MKLRFLISLLPVCCLAGAGEEAVAYQLATRYAPYADWASWLKPAAITEKASPGWWQTPEAIRRGRSKADRPLSGLRLALEPGHIGGFWAEWEGRHFRMEESDYWVREGELVLEVAQRATAELRRQGAQVDLLRNRSAPLNPKTFQDYWAAAQAESTPPTDVSLEAQLAHALAVRDRAMRKAIITGELAERARLVNEAIRPDAFISIHINAAPWPAVERKQLVDSDHAHVLIFGSLLAEELAAPEQRARLMKKLTNGSGPIESELGEAMGEALAEATRLPASNYSGNNAVRLEGRSDYLWARNLMLLRLVDCPAVMLEPYIANSDSTYPRIQEALRARAHHEPLSKDDILIEYADAMVAGVNRAYAGQP